MGRVKRSGPEAEKEKKRRVAKKKLMVKRSHAGEILALALAQPCRFKCGEFFDSLRTPIIEAAAALCADRQVDPFSIDATEASSSATGTCHCHVHGQTADCCLAESTQLPEPSEVLEACPFATTSIPGELPPAKMRNAMYWWVMTSVYVSLSFFSFLPS